MKTAIFDMDGTLVDSMYYWRAVGVELLRDMGFQPSPELIHELSLTSIRQSPPIMRRYFDITASDEELNLDFDRRMREHYAHDVALKPHAADYLRKLRGEGVRCVLATATWPELTMPLIERLGVREFFNSDGREYIVCADEMGMGKSSSEYYPTLCKKFGLDMRYCVMFEDALYSIKRAKAAGLAVWAIHDPTAERSEKEIKQLADRYFYDWQDLLS